MNKADARKVRIAALILLITAILTFALWAVAGLPTDDSLNCYVPDDPNSFTPVCP